MDKISSGGMATVYRARDERLDRPVALKVMHPHLSGSPDLVARFRREARATARINHPSVVSVFDQGIVNGAGYLVMELVDGTNLRERLREEGSLS
ncbi:protein kinase domain-containing protein, partial [Bacillus cereus]|uniref:protein kinase domain-containing protein n=1 Tax=Bacillus cereus TaxID=1396 RepID=UPI0028525007